MWRAGPGTVHANVRLGPLNGDAAFGGTHPTRATGVSLGTPVEEESMAQDVTGPRESSAAAAAGTIEKGWSVYDALERPVGNVTDVEGGRIRIDGRPEGLGYLNLPLAAVRSAGDNEVYLSLRMEDFHEHDPDSPPMGVAGITTEAGAVGSGPITRSPADSARGEPVAGSSYTAAGQPVGVGSNTPVGDEPDSFRAWDQSVEQSSGRSWLAWLAPLAAAMAGVAGYFWWRRRTRRSRLQRLGDFLAGAGESARNAARERPWYWWLAPAAALPLALYLRSGEDEDTDSPTGRAPGTTVGWRERASSSTERPASSWSDRVGWADRSAWGAPADLFRREDDEAADLWMLSIPAAMAALAAGWYALGGRKRSSTDRRLADIMARDVQTVRPDATVFEAASLMRRLNVGALPVCDGRRLRGMLTDRDVVVRAVADGRDPHLTSAADAMSSEIVYAYAEDSVSKGARLMRQQQVRRLPIVDQDKNLVGIVSLGDLAVDTGDDALSGETLERISEGPRPSH